MGVNLRRTVGRAKGKFSICKIFHTPLFLHPRRETPLTATLTGRYYRYFHFTRYRLLAICSKLRWKKSSSYQYGLLSHSTQPFTVFSDILRIKYEASVLRILSYVFSFIAMSRPTNLHRTTLCSKVKQVCKCLQVQGLRSPFWSTWPNAASNIYNKFNFFYFHFHGNDAPVLFQTVCKSAWKTTGKAVRFKDPVC